MADGEERKRHALPLSRRALKGAPLVSSDMVGLVALDFILGIVLRRVVDMSLVIEISRVDRDHSPRHPARLGIPAYVIADFKPLSHLVDSSLIHDGTASVCGAACRMRVKSHDPSVRGEATVNRQADANHEARRWAA